MELTASLFDDLLSDPSLHVPAKATRGYRNKVTYSLGQSFTTTNLAAADINAVCMFVNTWALETSMHAAAWWCEVSCKCTRRGELLVRLTILADSAEQYTAWRQSELPRFLADVAAAFRRLKCVALQAGIGSETHAPVKPTKVDPFTIEWGDAFVTEESPNGVPFRLSPDTFSEVNHLMEAEIFGHIERWCRDWYGGKAVLLTMGRDINARSFGLFEASQRSWPHVFALTHCNLASADATANHLMHQATHPPASYQPPVHCDGISPQIGFSTKAAFRRTQ